MNEQILPNTFNAIVTVQVVHPQWHITARLDALVLRAQPLIAREPPHQRLEMGRPSFIESRLLIGDAEGMMRRARIAFGQVANQAAQENVTEFVSENLFKATVGDGIGAHDQVT